MDPFILRIAFFLFCTFLLICFSWRSLGNLRSHGFYRFFAFEAILLLLMLNQPYWFRNPFSYLQLLSWLLLFASLFLVLSSLFMLRQHGGQDWREEFPENLPFENTVHIVDKGPYHYIRHPMYSSLLLLGWGAFFKQVTLASLLLAACVTIFLVATAKVEEQENIHFFGEPYHEYRTRTKMLLPWLL